MEAVVLAGGLGKRLRPAVSDVPKPLAPVNGRPFLELLLDYWIAQGIRRIVLSVGYMHEAIEKAIGNSHGGCPVTYAVETAPAGTGGGLLLGAEKLAQPGPFLVLNGDTMFAVRLPELAGFHRERRAEITLALFGTTDPRYTPIGTDAEGRIQDTERSGLANGGVYVVERALVESLPWKAGTSLSFERELLPHLVKSKRRVFGRPSEGVFLDIGVPEDYARAPAVAAQWLPSKSVN